MLFSFQLPSLSDTGMECENLPFTLRGTKFWDVYLPRETVRVALLSDGSKIPSTVAMAGSHTSIGVKDVIVMGMAPFRSATSVVPA